MTTHIGILPLDLLNALSIDLDRTTNETSANTRFLRLPHPRTGIPSLFVPCASENRTGNGDSSSTSGILEVQAVTPPNSRSWFLNSEEVIADGKMLIMTPIDPMFLLLPLMQISHPTQKDGTLGTLRQLDDIFEDAATKLSRVSETDANKDPSLKVSEQDILFILTLNCVREAARLICEVNDLTPELAVYRYDPERVIKVLQKKVEHLAQPAILDRTRTVVRSLAKDGLMEDGQEELLELGRKKAACEILSQYLPSDIYAKLLATYDFSTLETYTNAIREADAAITAANETTNGSKKGKKKGTATANQEKKEDTASKKRKGASSQGVDRLKKVNTDGMKKISSFFVQKK